MLDRTRIAKSSVVKMCDAEAAIDTLLKFLDQELPEERSHNKVCLTKAKFHLNNAKEYLFATTYLEEE